MIFLYFFTKKSILTSLLISSTIVLQSNPASTAL